MRQVVVRKLKFDGSVRSEWPGDLVESTAEWAVVYHDPLRHEKRQDAPSESGVPAHLLHYVGLRLPVTVLFAYSSRFEFLDAKCDAALPGALHGDRLDFVDLDLDVIVLPGGQHYVRDQEIFAERAVSMGYDDRTKRVAHLGILHSLRMVRGRKFPFDGSAEALVRGLASGTRERH